VNDRILVSLWSQHASWAEVASRLKARRMWWRVVVVLLAIGGAASQILAVAVENTGIKRAASAVGIVALSLVALLSCRFLTPTETRKWLRSRSVSERIKSEIYAFRAGAAPYLGEGALEELRMTVGSIVDWAKDMSLEVEVGLISSQVPPPLDAALYVDHRVARQIARCSRHAKVSRRRAQVLHWILILVVMPIAGFVGMATVFAVGPANFAQNVAQWSAIVTLIIGSVAACAARIRYELQATLALATARQLQGLVDEWRASCKQTPSPEWSEFVRACEQIISAESRSWKAKVDPDRLDSRHAHLQS